MRPLVMTWHRQQTEARPVRPSRQASLSVTEQGHIETILDGMSCSIKTGFCHRTLT